ncbi:hypothetical protein GCM10009412_10420 [Aeromonas salmonicida subsp. achromogenes]
MSSGRDAHADRESAINMAKKSLIILKPPWVHSVSKPMVTHYRVKGFDMNPHLIKIEINGSWGVL